ncbi:molybdenum cofactor biosysynthesis protein [Pseudovibrio japonicus]|uniref:Molybdenum cofactor biosysynthesis protein n=1 Tax=Pseudovibrio japonicus TaxID=366534 RepID=A0ABQ3ELZ2_9HYPH|nr:MOSC N-terminal beta barrel domain-containing protein [Pseudovibrio japonicus]GHB40029.1 molybdenum cofactor biosysynthesis protein [Pseudovibrio japonicus]
MKVQALWHYPIKSLLGETLQKLEVNERGVVGDRHFAIANEQGKFGSGKNTRRFRRIDNLLALRAFSSGDSLSVGFPDGRRVDVHSEDINGQLTEFLGQPVAIVPEQDIPHFDDGPVHLLLSSELAKLQSLVPDARVDERRFRSNIILDAPEHASDGDLIGKVLTIGEVQLEVTHKTERCRMVTIEQDDLKFEPEILRPIAREFDVNFGVYSKVVRTGAIEVGQDVIIS